MSNIAFLFGSGISLCSGYPRMQNITDRILSGDNIGRHTDLNYYFDFEQDYLKSYVENNVILLNYINTLINDYYKDLNLEHSANYEDIYYVLRQVLDSETFEFENPALKHLIDDLKSHFREILNKYNITLNELIKDCLRYIQCVIWHKLRITPNPIDQLNILKEFHEDKRIKKIYLMSLNHDLLIENFFTANNIPFTDGFQTKSKKIPEWNFDLLKSNEYKINLLKLHGSIDWFNISDKNNIQNIYKIPSDVNVDYIYKIDESLQRSDGLPLFLVGTFNKLLNYLSFIYEELYQFSQLVLNQCEYLIISGYGFNDKGVNINLIKWLYSSNAKMIVIIHPNFDNLRKYARGAYNIYFDPQQPSPFSNHKLKKIEKKFEDVTYKELLSIIKE